MHGAIRKTKTRTNRLPLTKLRMDYPWESLEIKGFS
jgi:hypothetical protein